jgi:Tfp pilus assembly protein PilF
MPDTNTPKPSKFEKPILFGFALRSTSVEGQIQIQFRWFRITGAMLTFFAASWLVTAGALFFYFKYNKEYSEVTYSDMLVLPVKYSELLVEMGDFHVSKGLDQLKDQNYREALRLLRLGVARSPGNLEGRRVLSEFYEFALKRPDLAADMLLRGFEYDAIEHPDYLKSTASILLRNQMDDEIQELADKFLPKEPVINETNQILAFASANANFLRGNFDRADDYLYDYNLTTNLEGLILSAKISWERNNRTAAITKLEKSLERYPNSNTLLLQLSRYHRENGDMEEALRYAILRNIIFPLDPNPRIELLYTYEANADYERVKSEALKILSQFSDDESALRNLANFAAHSGNISIARRAYEEALERDFSIDAFALLLIEAHLVKEDYPGALEFTEELAIERPDWLESRLAIFNSLRSVIAFGLNRADLGEIYLQEFLSERPAANTSLAVAKRFNYIARYEQALKVLLDAYESNRGNQKVLSELIRVELALGRADQLSQRISKLLQMRRPEMGLLKEAYEKMGSDRFIFANNREELLLQLSAILRENNLLTKSES